MRQVVVQEGEEVVAQFRPHPAAYLHRYAWGVLWLAWGAAALALQPLASDVPALSLFAFTAFAFVHALLQRLAKQRGVFLTLLWAALALGVAVAVAADVARDQAWLPYGALLLAAPPALAVLGLHELDRRLRRMILTTRRIRVRGGIARRHEHAIDLERVQSVRGVQGALAQLFGYGDLVFVYSSRAQPKTGQVLEDTEVLSGVPRFQHHQRALDTVLSDLRLPDRERRKRQDERRLRDSMRTVAAWVSREGS